jgi:hypothetical protein
VKTASRPSSGAALRGRTTGDRKRILIKSMLSHL